MKITQHLKIPPAVETGLLNGSMFYRGGVVRWAEGTSNGGRIVAHLREVGLDRATPDHVAAALGKAGKALSLVGSVASIINVGATVGFGVATLSKLGRMEQGQEQLLAGQERFEAGQQQLLAGQGRLEAGQQQLGVTVDHGFRLMFAEFQSLAQGQARIEGQIDQKFHEQVLVKLSSASRDMDTLSSLSLDDPRRVNRVENILDRTSQAFQALHLEAEKRSKALAGAFHSKTSGRAKLALNDADLVAVQHLRLLASAAAQHARVLAEAGQPEDASRFLSAQAKQLRESLLKPIGEAFFQGHLVYDELLHHFWPTVGITSARIGAWASRFDPATGGLEGVIRKIQEAAAAAGTLDRTLRAGGHFLGIPVPPETVASRLRRVLDQRANNESPPFDEPTKEAIIQLVAEASTGGLTAIDAQIHWSDQVRKSAPEFLDLLDGVWEDIDRLEGHAAEYAEMSRLGLRVAEYGQRLRVDNVPEGVRVVFMTDDEELVEDEVEQEPKAGLRVRVPR